MQHNLDRHKGVDEHDDSDADALAALSLMVIVGLAIVYYLSQ